MTLLQFWGGRVYCEISLWILITFIDCHRLPSFNGGASERE